MKQIVLKTLAASVLFGLVASPVLAQDNHGLSSEFNPYAPAHGHGYRHGAVPTREVHQKMKHYRDTHASTAAATSSNTLAYGGGVDGVGVMDGHVKVYIVYYGSQWGTRTTNSKGDSLFSGDSYGAAAVAEEMFKGIGTGNELWSADLTQWCDGPNVSTGATSCPSNASFVPYQTGGVLAGVFYDNAAAAPSAPTATDLANEAIKAAAHFGNTAQGSNRYTYYIVMSPHGTDPDNYQSPTQGYCAWHNYTTSSYGDIAYSNQPYNMDMGSSCGVNFVNSGTAGNLDGWTMTLGHEWHEMMSDTYPAGGWTNTSSGQENSDECAWIAAGQAGGAANVAMGTGTFTEQASWSNDTNSCAISHAILHGGSTGGTPVANFTDTVNGLTVNFTDASTDTGGTISSYSWNFGDGASATTANPSHTYAAAGTYNVTETVTDSTGATNSKTASVTVSSGSTGKPVANFTDTVSGLIATFTDSSTDTGGTISSHSWTFGDGGTSTTTSPSHTYTAAGTYSVTETVKDNTGASSSKTASVTVTAPSGGTFSNNTKKVINDNATITSNISVTGEPGAAPSTLQVHVNITHNWSGDLEIDLVAPNGAYAVLQSPDYNDDGNINTTYTVDASSVQGNGTWKLRVIDNDPWYSGDYGTLNGWSLTF